MFASQTFFCIVGWFACFLGRPIRFSKGFWFAFLRFCHWWDVKPLGGDFFYLPRVSFPSLLNGPQVDTLLSFFFFCLFACRMAKGYEEVSCSQAGRRRGTPLETPTKSSLVATMFVEELRLYS